jgi:CPA2 family monovalent cation:H+ antiporter-2
MHLSPLIFDLAIILAVAGMMSLLFQWLKQPVVLGYILAGVIVGPYTPPFELVKDIAGIQTWAELGVIFLMFTLGLEFSFRKLLNVGVTAGVTAGLEVIFFLGVGYGIGRWLSWSVMDSIFLGAMLSISSTTIIIKALEELKLKTHRFSSLIFGVLIVEDLFAILLIVGLTTIASSGSFSFIALASAALNLAVVVGSWFITGYFLVPRLMSYVSRKGNNEMLTLVSIALCLSLVVLASYFGYSAALGAFIMGSILAETKVLHQIEDLMAPLRDLFGGIFFVSIGMLIDPKIMWEYKATILLLCFVTIFGKIFITSLGALISGQSFKNSIQVGFGLAQIGEFSFIIAGLGVALNVTSNKLYPIGVAVSLVTTFTTPYLIKFSGTFAEAVDKKLPWRVRELMNRYVAWCEHRQNGGQKYKDAFPLLSRWVINGILVTFLFNLSFTFLLPLISNNWGKHITWLVAFLVSTPFIWGMVFTSRKNYLRIRKEKNTTKAIIVLLLPVLTSIWIGVLSAQHFQARFILPITFAFLLLIYFALFKK